jgi:hypothetical protein
LDTAALGGRVVGEQPIAKFADGEACDGREGWLVVGVDDEACDVVRLVGYDGFVEECGERDICEGHLGDDASLGVRGGDASQFVSGT